MLKLPESTTQQETSGAAENTVEGSDSANTSAPQLGTDLVPVLADKLISCLQQLVRCVEKVLSNKCPVKLKHIQQEHLK